MLRYRGFRLTAGPPCGHLEPPVGAVSLVLLLEGKLLLGSAPGGPLPTAAYTSPVCGLHTTAMVSEHESPLTGIEIALAPWAAYRMFGIPMDQLTDNVMEASELLGHDLAPLTDALAAAPDWPARFALLDAELTGLLAGVPPHAPPVAAAWTLLARHCGAVPISQLARHVGWSQSQLERRFQEQIGVTPKAAARVLRLRRSLRLLSEGRPAAQVAELAGYYDQAHFSREFKAMTGCPARLLAKCRDCSEFLQDRGSPRPAQYFSPEHIRETTDNRKW
ncbi:helix-turn-helix domain-containing protein [Streptomyces sp. NBC_01304]|uniref:helix-turn-helix domain-containing protein n=1 Tax=Streptomyces sp. NBC_01304 TaxID=2903818 RepID=UPI002E15B9A5|nr:AraC family transcriptional regulator [Streptomyces sp. NBC_01304]